MNIKICRINMENYKESIYLKGKIFNMDYKLKQSKVRQ